jgi:ornithine cyclodeaminase/alanine dehydrogenase-like protein (mu-crystallin family)
MAKIYSRAQIEAVIRPVDVITAMEEAFVVYSQGNAVVPPPGHLTFDEPPGDCHIKYGYIRGGATFTVKIATGFWRNPGQGLASSNGVILVFSSQTGELLAILQDEGYLTDVRTAAAGAVAAKHLAPAEIDCIGIVGAGTQARLQLRFLREVTGCRRVMLWARSEERARMFQEDGFEIRIASTPSELAQQCQLIVTTTPSEQWLLAASDIQPGTHITAVGADGGGKQELDPQLFASASVCAVDSRSQCSQYGDSSYAIKGGWITPDSLIELGQIIEDPGLGRQAEDDITIADLTGVAVQDIEIAALALDLLSGQPGA